MKLLGQTVQESSPPKVTESALITFKVKYRQVLREIDPKPETIHVELGANGDRRASLLHSVRPPLPFTWLNGLSATRRGVTQNREAAVGCVKEYLCFSDEVRPSGG